MTLRLLIVVLIALESARAGNVNTAGTPITFPATAAGSSSSPITLDYEHVGMHQHTITRIRKATSSACDAYSITGSGFVLDPNGVPNPPPVIANTATGPWLTVTFSPSVVAPTFNCVVLLEEGAGVPIGSFELRGSSFAGSAPEIVVSPMSIDIGTITMGQMGTGLVTIENTGNASLTYRFDVTGPGFATTACPQDCTLAGGGMISHSITFMPPSLGPADGLLVVTSNDSNEATTMVPLMAAGAAPGTTGTLDPTTGDLAFGKVPIGTTAARAIEITNSGAASFTIMGAAFSDPAFGVSPATPLPIVVAVGGSTMLELTCTPSLRAAYAGTATVTTTAGNGNLSVSLACTGAAEVTLPGEIAFGVVAVGHELRLDSAIDLHNIATGATFVVREVRLADETGPFTIDVAGGSLDPGAHLVGDAVFTPVEAGRYEARVEVYLDDDPMMHGEILMTGHAIELAPTGGCTSGSPLGVAMVGLVMFLLGRRRAGALVFAIAIPANARADVLMQTHRPNVSIGDAWFQIEAPSVAATSWGLGLTAGYARDPLRLELVDCGGECPDGYTQGELTPVIRTQGLLALGGSFAYATRFELGVMVPMVIQSGRDASLMSGPDGVALGDIGVRAKVVLWRSAAFTLGAGANVTAPTATADQHAGSDGPTARLVMRAGWERTKLQLGVEVGVLGRRTATLGTLRQGSEVDAGAGVAYRVRDRVAITAEIFGSFGAVDGSQNLVQSLVGARARVSGGISLGVAVGAALVPGAGAPTFRGLVAVTYTAPSRRAPIVEKPVIVDTRPVVSPPKPEATPDTDTDRDSILDSIDQCPAEPEDRDGFADADGCPDLDNDQDRIADAIDACPDVVGPASFDGCPDDDKDRDGVADATDRCPSATETINGNADDDGCPDSGDSLVLVGKSRIDLFDAIRFTGADIDPASANVLSQLALALRADRAISRLQIIVHVRASGDKNADADLARRRASSIVGALTSRGVSARRLDGGGAGSDKPLAAASPGAAINDRVELLVARTTP